MEAVNITIASRTDVCNTPELRVRLLIARGRQLRDAGRYTEAEPVLGKALAAAEVAFELNSVEIAGVLNHLGMLGKYNGLFDEAEDAYRRALLIVAGSETALTADLYHNLGGLAHARGHFAKGEPYARRSVEIRERLLGPDHADTASDVAALAALLDGQARYVEAERLYCRALAVFERYNDADRCDVAVIMNNLAALYQATGHLDEAEQLYLRSIRAKEKQLGKNHPDLALTLNNLAVLYRSQKKMTEAASLYCRAIAIFEKTLDADHPRLTACRKNFDRLQREIYEFMVL
jgi:tetratricopeptide (TPR) repeat protein